MRTMPIHSPTLHPRYKRTSISKPLYANLSDKQFRLLRIVPGTRRGEFAAQIFETDITEASVEYEYSILTLVPRSESQERRKGRCDSNGIGGNEDEELTYFPILSLGGGEHQIELPSKVKRALERVVEERWDCFHSTRYSPETRRDWQGRPKSATAAFPGERQQSQIQAEAGNQLLKAANENDDNDEGAEAEVDSNDEDGESDTGEGEDFFLWIRDICVDRTDDADKRQQDQLLGKICEGAKEMIVADVPDSMSGQIEIERLENLGCVKSISDAYHIEAVQETFEAMRWEQTVERAWRGGWR